MSERDTAIRLKRSGSAPSCARLYIAGSSLRCARSPVPPKITSVVGCTGRRSSPSTSGFSCSTTATGLLRVRLALSRGICCDHRVAAELIAQSGVHLGGEVAHVARAESLVQRGGDDRHGHALVDRVLDRPAALAGVLDVGRDRCELVALLLEGTGEELAEPRANHRALHPEMGDLR